MKSMRRDLAIMYSEVPAKVSAVFTQNLVVAEPIKLTKKHLEQTGYMSQAIVCNSGNANAVTGKQGEEGALAMAKVMADELKIDTNQVMVASTGVIGRAFPTEEVVDGIKENVKKISENSRAGSFAANAILTTDTFAKEGFVEFQIDGNTINIGGIAKGSGMIHPNMATMLAFAFTDLNIDQKLLDKAFREAVDDSFNMITVDGDTSTNDSFVIAATGAIGGPPFAEGSADALAVREAIFEVCETLAQAIADSDGYAGRLLDAVKAVEGGAYAPLVSATVGPEALAWLDRALAGGVPGFPEAVAAGADAASSVPRQTVGMAASGTALAATVALAIALTGNEQAPVAALPGLVVETWLLLPVALIYAVGAATAPVSLAKTVW